jgi:hypothetical protein
MALEESTRLERLRVIRDAEFVDRFEASDTTVTLSPGADEDVTGGATPSSTVTLTPGVDDSTAEQRTGRLIDDFEDADLAEYQGDVDDPDITVQGNVVDDGTYALQMTTGDTGTTADYFIYSTADLPIYPEPNDRFEVSVYITSPDADSVFAFGVQNVDNFYFTRIGAGEDEFELVKLETGTETVLDSTGVTIPEDEWLTVDVSWYTDGTIEAGVTNAAGTAIGSVAAVDSTLGAGGVGFGEAQNFED